MHASRTVGKTYCTKIIIHISQNKRGVAATLAYPYVGLTYVNDVVYPYVGLTYVNDVVAKIVHRYYFTINIAVPLAFSSCPSCVWCFTALLYLPPIHSFSK